MADSTDDPINHVRPGTPIWVKVLGVIALVLGLLIVIVVVTGAGGEHGPGRHTSGDPGGQPSNSSGSATAGVVGEQPDATEATRTVDVATLDAMAFQPSAINVSPCHESGHYATGMRGRIAAG